MDFGTTAVILFYFYLLIGHYYLLFNRGLATTSSSCRGRLSTPRLDESGGTEQNRVIRTSVDLWCFCHIIHRNCSCDEAS